MKCLLPILLISLAALCNANPFFDVIKRNVPAVEVITDQLGGDGKTPILVSEGEAEQIKEDLETNAGVDDAEIGAERVLTAAERKMRALIEADKQARAEAGVYNSETGEHMTFDSMQSRTSVFNPKSTKVLTAKMQAEARKQKKSVAKKATKKVTKKVAALSGKAKSESTRPKCSDMVFAAIKSVRSFGKGVSRATIYKYIGDNYPGTSMSAVRRAIQKNLDNGYLQHGSTKARFKLTDAGKDSLKPKKKAKKPKKKKSKKVKKVKKAKKA